MTPDTDAAEAALTAAILADGSVPVDEFLDAVAREHQALGRRVGGLVMTHPQAQRGCLGDMVLVDVRSREPYLVSQQLGPGSCACRADTQGFARASGVLRHALEEGSDLIVCNRFGALEAEGEGFTTELLAIVASGIPLLTAVAPRHRAAWDRFTGGAPVLPARRDAVNDWIEHALAPGARR